jgi:hypothetical protein
MTGYPTTISSDVWCAECERPSIADFHIKGETVALCAVHIAARFPSELYANPGKWDLDSPQVPDATGAACSMGYLGCPCRQGADHFTEAEARALFGDR